MSLASFNSGTHQSKKYAITKIVIDAGHGGVDPGCVGKKSKEKDVALDIVLKLGNYIKSNFKDVEVIYTRSDDSFVELYRRAKIANEKKADLFISVHCNASKSKEPYGVETFVMGINKSAGNFDVASKENASIYLESDYKNQYDNFDPSKGFNPDSPEFMISYNLYQKTYLEQSLDFAAKVQNQLSHHLNRFNRGVKQAGFLVLWKTTMPGVLIETGFLSNLSEEEFMITESGRKNIALSIFRAFKEYKSKLEGVPYSDNIIEPERPLIKAESEKSTVTIVKQENKNNLSTDSIPKQPHINNESTVSSDNQPKEIVFKVQFATGTNKKLLSAPELKEIEFLDCYQQEGLYKFTVGKSDKIDDAVTLMNKMKRMGYKDAFVIAFSNGKRVSVKEAVSLLKH